MEDVGKTPPEETSDGQTLTSINALSVLGLLSVAPMTAYGLAEQIQRALSFLWPVSRSLLLGQPKKLAEAGLVETLPPAPGSRASKRWAATETGRAVFRKWLSTDVETTRISSEIGLRLVFSDQGSLESLQRQLEIRRQQIIENYRQALALTDGYLANQGPFPGRLHIIAATLLLTEGHAEGELRGVEAAQTLVETWADTTTPEPARDLAVIEQVRERILETLARLEA
ncbi:PadR family transcriptional regulator [Nocardioides marmorisolisilvae]|uniref:PadR family transcriptional regulator n=1 Tax=Nocardioides marmorisolisilvae TaxID=1542737 RepID=A0A3N0DPM3_9ACTN|nr:PadR family transcriptional regulator [Nocardioides marmorisolisilvae]RNL77584.1 PadR family transcriptional regulator [Nocardioides marmorisolisilvae]